MADTARDVAGKYYDVAGTGSLQHGSMFEVRTRDHCDWFQGRNSSIHLTEI